MTPATRAAHWISRNRQEVAWAIAVVLALLVILGLTQRWWDEITAFLNGTNVAVFVAMVCVLPLAGVSITLVYVVVGARFGGPLGIALIAAATAVHLLATHLIAQSMLRGRVERMLRRHGHRLPAIARDEPVALALLGALVPGLPYVARNYLLALSGVPLRIYFLICWPVYVARSGVAIAFGHWAGDITTGRVAILSGVLGLQFAICALVVRHLHRKYASRRTKTTATRRARAG